MILDDGNGVEQCRDRRGDREHKDCEQRHGEKGVAGEGVDAEMLQQFNDHGVDEIDTEAVFRHLAEERVGFFTHAREIQMLLGKDEDRHARAENVEVVVVIKGGIWRALRSGENGGSDDGEKTQ